MMMLSSVLSDKVETYLGERNFAELQEEILKPQNRPHINNEGMELITKLCENGLAFANDFDSIDACTRCLEHVVYNYKPKESLVCLLEQGEAFANSDKFTYLLPSLQFVMMNLPKKREKTFSWVLSILKSHIKYYRHFPDDLKTSLIHRENDETLLMEQDSRIKPILQDYRSYIQFYTPFVEELGSNCSIALATNDSEGIESCKKQQHYLRDYLVDLLGIPLIHFDLEWNEKTDDFKQGQNQQCCSTPKKIGPTIKTDARIIAESIMKLLETVDDCPLNYLQWIEERMSYVSSNSKGANSENNEDGESSKPVNTIKDSDDEDEEEEEEVVVHMSSLVTYLYLIFDQRLPVQRLSKVHSPTYMFNMILYPVTTVLKNSGNILALHKAIRLASTILNLCDTTPCLLLENFSYAHRFHRNLLKQEIHRVFIDRIAYLAIYCQDKNIRRDSYTLFKQYMMNFEPQGKYDLILYILNSIPSDSLAGQMINELKQFIYIATDPEHFHFEKGMEECFLGTSGIRLISSVCCLKNGVTTDLCQYNHQIISALNLIRFLLLRDKHEKKIGILELFPKIEELMINPLRKGLDLSRAHYELKLKELNDPHLRKEREKEERKMFDNLGCDVEIGGETMKPGDISLEEQKASVNSAITTFDHMNGLLAWVNEAYSSCKS